MSKLIMALLQLLILTLTITHVTLARTTPNPTQTTPPPLSTPSQDFLSSHNQARAVLNVAPLKWSQLLANATARVVAYQKAKNNCQFADFSSNTTKYGVNQLWAKGVVVSPKMVVDAWVSEKKFYDYGSNSCVANHHCGVYTQVVWRKSVELGCAQASCKDGSILTVCFYNPPGNIVGEKPY